MWAHIKGGKSTFTEIIWIVKKLSFYLKSHNSRTFFNINLNFVFFFEQQLNFTPTFYSKKHEEIEKSIFNFSFQWWKHRKWQNKSGEKLQSASQFLLFFGSRTFYEKERENWKYKFIASDWFSLYFLFCTPLYDLYWSRFPFLLERVRHVHEISLSYIKLFIHSLDEWGQWHESKRIFPYFFSFLSLMSLMIFMRLLKAFISSSSELHCFAS